MSTTLSGHVIDSPTSVCIISSYVRFAVVIAKIGEVTVYEQQSLHAGGPCSGCCVDSPR